MPERRRFKQIDPLDKRLSDEAQRLRKEARGTLPGVERDRLIRKARLAETASRMTEWIQSPGLQPPRWDQANEAAWTGLLLVEAGHENASPSPETPSGIPSRRSTAIGLCVAQASQARHAGQCWDGQSSQHNVEASLMTEQQIQDHAHALWEKAGRPDGRDLEFWHAAVAELNAEKESSAPIEADQPNTTTLPGW
jgi:Protein of unknown function (DUF2934)